MFDEFFKKNKAACISGVITFILAVTLFILRSLVTQEVSAVETAREQLLEATSEVSTQQVDIHNLMDDLNKELSNNKTKTETVISLENEIREMD